MIHDSKRILELASTLFHAYKVQFANHSIQWLRMSSGYIRRLAKIPGTEVLVCWYIPDLKKPNKKEFAGFLINLDGQFNHRMGIMPKFRHKESNQTDDHLIYFRLTLRNIELNLQSGKRGMWIAQTGYEAKRRLGFNLQPLVSYRRAVTGFNFVSDTAYQKLMGEVNNPDVLYRF